MTQMIDRVAAKLKREVSEMPVGFKWFADGLFNGSLAFCGEESAGATFARRDGTVWTTDKDGIVSALLAAEITARTGHDPGDLYDELAAEFGDCYSERIDTAATMPQKRRLASISPAQITCRTLAGDEIVSVMDHALGNHEAIGGIKVTTKEGWFAARPSGTEDVLKTYAESFLGEAHLRRILAEAQVMVEGAIAADSPLTTALTAPVITPVIPPVIAPDSLPTR